MGFGVIDIQKRQTFLPKFFFSFLICHYGFTNCFKILNFVFSNIIPRGVSTCKILTFQDQYFQKYKAQKIVKFSFLAFSTDKNFALKTCGTLKMILLIAQSNFCVTLSSYVEGHVKKKSSLNFMSLVGFQAPKSGFFLENFLWSQFGNHFQVEITPQSPLFFYFLTVFHVVWKNQESCES